MSQVYQPAVREDVEIDARRMTPARRARIIAHHGGVCAYPGCEVTEGLQVDHIICLGLGGKDRDDNLEPLCDPHHKAKTRRDKKLIAKANRLRAREDGTRRARQKIHSAGFRKHPNLKRAIGGGVKARCDD